MLGQFWDRLALASPEAGDPEHDARLMRGLIATLSVAMLVTLLFESLAMHRPALHYALWASLALMGLAYRLVLGHVLAPARFIIVLVALGVVSVALYTGYSGIHGVTVMMLPAVIVLGSLVLSRRGFIVITVLTVLSADGLVVADVHDLITTRYHDVATYLDTIAPTAFLLLTALLVRLLAADLVRSADRAKRHERELAVVNRNLGEQRVALERSEAQWRTYIQNASDFLFGLDQAGRFAWVNRAVCDTLDYQPVELVGQSAFDILAPHSREAAAEAFRRVMTGERVDQMELEARTRDGQSVFFDLRGRVVNDGDTVTSTFYIGRDVTARKESETERRRLDLRAQQIQKLESLGVLAGGIAHDFNNLLMTILGNIDLAMEEVPKGNPAQEFLRNADAASRRASELTRHMLAYSGRGRFVVRPLDISAFLKDMAPMLTMTVPHKIKLTFALGASLPPIDADASQIRQAVTNLVLNASEAVGNQGGAIAVSTGAGVYTSADLVDHWLHADLPEGMYVWMQVTDSGVGMDPETMARIFDPFFSTKFTGRGLGLPAVLGIVRGHQGLITVTSTPGAGSSFRMLFPVAKAAAQVAPPADRDVGLRVGTGTILLVDDEDGVRRVAKSMLERLGYDVLEAADGQQAIDVFATHASLVRAVLLDVTLPEMDGLAVRERLTQIDPAVRVVLSSGYAEQDIEQLAGNRGRFAFLQKPYQIRALGETLKNVLA
ncbi:MAG: PAS domain S-box protein [Acidobacteriota bacterium]